MNAERPDPLSTDPVVKACVQAGQGHIFQWLGEIAPKQKELFLNQLRGFDWKVIDNAIASYQEVGTSKSRNLEPASIVRPSEEEARDAARVGEELLRSGKVGMILVAGGQGTRLGFPGPKGMYPLGPVTGKTLFEIHAEKVMALRQRYGVPIPWYIMTSDATHQTTVEFFRENDFWNLPEDDVVFFAQNNLPAISFEGKLVLESKDRLFTAPNGHGGTIYALKESGALEDMQRRGIEQLSYFQVDNPLVNIGDRVFIGLHASGKSDMSSKVLQKRNAEEPLGVVCRVDGKLSVVEYIDLPEDHMYATDEGGALKFGAGSIAIHMIAVDFIRKINEEGIRLPLHFSKKKVPCIDDRGCHIEPTEPNAVKFEMFIFDALPMAHNPITFQTNREDEFAPVKNAKGQDSPASAQQLMINQFGRWLSNAGVDIPTDTEGNVIGRIEISPLFALDEEELNQKIDSSLEFNGELSLKALTTNTTE